MDLTTPQWQHDPTRTPDTATDEDRRVMTDLEADWAELHRTAAGACWGCWCYGCGGRTDQPRDRRQDTRQDLPEPDSHRWCFE